MVRLSGGAFALSLPGKDHEVEVVGLAPAEEGDREMFISVTWEQPTLAVPLAQLESIQTDKVTRLAVQDWHYWVEQGYQS
jgi:hypothetical protein